MHVRLHLGGDFVRVLLGRAALGDELQNDMGRALGGLEDLACGQLLDRALRALDDGVEWHEVQLLHRIQRGHVHGSERECVQCISWRLLPLGSHCGVAQQGVLGLTCLIHGGLLLDHHFVHGERAGLVGAENGHACHVFNGG